MKIRPIEEKDAAAIFFLIKTKAEFDGCLDLLTATEVDITKAFFAVQPRAFALVAEVDQQLVGIATYYSIYSTFIAKPGIWLDDLFVSPPFRKMGIGKALIRELCAIAQENDCARIDWIVAHDNENARGFYQSMGARVFDDVRHSRLNEMAIAKLVGEGLPQA